MTSKMNEVIAQYSNKTTVEAGSNRTIVTIELTFNASSEEVLAGVNKYNRKEGQEEADVLDPENIMYLALVDEGYLPNFRMTQSAK